MKKLYTLLCVDNIGVEKELMNNAYYQYCEDTGGVHYRVYNDLGEEKLYVKSRFKKCE